MRGPAQAVLVTAVACSALACAGHRPAAPVPGETAPAAGAPATVAPANLITLDVPDDPTLTFKVWFRVGSHDDPPGKQGLAYLTGQMLASAATTRHRYDEILERLYPLASGYDVRVDREMTVLSGRTHRDNRDVFFDLFTDAYLRPAFAEDDFERLKTDTLNFLKNTLRFSSDEELAKAAFFSFVYDGLGYAHPPEGTVRSVEALTLDDVKAFYRDHFTRQNAVPALGGSLDPELKRRFAASVDELPAAAPGASANPPALPERFAGKHVLLVDKPGADASISFGFPIEVRRGEREFYALAIANSWLGEHRNSSSHLFQVIREKRGLNYGDYAYIEAFPEGGRRSVPPTHVGRNRQCFEVWIRTLPNEQAHFALRAALRELKLLVDNGLTAEQFELTRAFLEKYVLHYADTTSARLGYAVDDRFYGVGGEGHLARFRRLMREITRDEVNAAIRKHIRLDDVKIAIVTGQAEALSRALAADAPSPISYPTAKDAAILAEDEAIASFRLGIDARDIRVVPLAEMFER